MKTAAPRVLAVLAMLALLATVWRLPVPQATVADETPATPATEKKPAENPFGEPQNAKRLDPKSPVWIDLEKKLVIVDGYVCLREGQLEMFACLKGTKEHESVVAVESKAYMIHAGLLAVGAKVGGPVQFDPKYVPASGTEIEVIVLWLDKDGKKHQVPAQDWIRHAETKKPMLNNWVFAGSGFWFDEMTGKEHYQAEGGDLICVSNFPSATLDLPVESSQTNLALLFEANTGEIPPLKTKVRLVLRPKFKPGEQEAVQKEGEKPAAEKPATAKPVAEKPASEKPVAEKPAGEVKKK